MERAEIAKKVTDILVDQLYVEEKEVKPEASLMDDLGADSLDCVEVLIQVESTFNINIEDEEADKCLTVGAVIDLVESKVQK